MEEDPLAEVGPKLSAGFTGALGGARMLMELRHKFASGSDSPEDVLDPATIDDTAQSRERFDEWWREQFPEWDQWYNDLLEQDQQTRDQQARDQQPSASDRADAHWRNVVDRHERGNATATDVATAAEVAERERFLEGTRGLDADAVPAGYDDAAHYEREARAAAYSQDAHDAFEQAHAQARAAGEDFNAAKSQGREAFDTVVAQRLQTEPQKTEPERPNPQATNDPRQFNGYGRSVLAADASLEASEAAWSAHAATGRAVSDPANKIPVGEWTNACDTAYQTTYESVAGKPDPSRPEGGESAIGKAYGEHYADKYAGGWRAHMDDGTYDPPLLAGREQIGHADADHAAHEWSREHSSEAPQTAATGTEGSTFELRDDVQARLGDSKGGSASTRLSGSAEKAGGGTQLSNTSSTPTPTSSGTDQQSSSSTVAASQEGPSMPGGSPDSQPSAAQGQDAPSMPGGSASSQPDPEAAATTSGAGGSKWMDQAYPDKQPNLGNAQNTSTSATSVPPPAVAQRKPPTAGRH